LEHQASKSHAFAGKPPAGLGLLIQSPADWLVLALLLMYAWFSMWISRDTSGFHDFLGGRFPVADGFDWLRDTLNAATSGYLSDYGAKRPLNVPFNVFYLWLGDRIAADPVLGSLLIKRLFSLGTIFFLVSVVRLQLSAAASGLTGFLMISALVNVRLPVLPQLLGQSLGYTSGTELNTFILVTAAVSLLLLACLLRSQRKSRLFLLLYCLGIVLLAASGLMRPGALLLTPSIIVIISMAPLLRLGPGVSFAQPIRMAILCASIGFMSLLLVKGVELAIFKQLITKCGAIGGNQGYSLFGMSSGGNYIDGIRMVKAMNLPPCDRIINPILMRMAVQRIIENPIPVIGLIFNNFRSLLSNYTFTLPALVLAALAWFSRLPVSARDRHLSACFSDRLREPALLAVAGCGSIALFSLVFLQEAGWRPATPYVAFPVLVYTILFEIVLSRFTRSQPPLLQAVAGYKVNPKLNCRLYIHHLLALLIAASIFTSLLLGLLLMRLGALGYRGYSSISGSVEQPLSWLEEWQSFNNLSPSMSEMYTLKRDQALAAPQLRLPGSAKPETICISFKRLQLPWDFPYGKLSVKSGNCL
jgi:hypothetical protein